MESIQDLANVAPSMAATAVGMEMVGVAIRVGEDTEGVSITISTRVSADVGAAVGEVDLAGVVVWVGVADLAGEVDWALDWAGAADGA